ncbi:hypothetical protein NB643_08985 [Oxalobacter aliiformigenes]|uniref:TubC N-terminal docking domain-containing protein n=1 Tax=Oxalobacter aliiformigenes TaxID=2946593 RepID=A0ABY7JLZ4_9BURK|nr:hypothetical protein [Oxalobacter aliiformigenes]WAV93577.1 hypothetical protein NB641_02150 [Oxalobacter aliiformigenes]WAV94926.1 hypothetical protein NB643_08985 [Oxalobacter aliiformigenes]WAV97272.1 hypothetical protein NB645_00475 [Oxalobacter aliiformigenes]
MNANELLEQCEKDGIRLCLQSGQLQITGNLKKIDELAPIIRQHKTDIIRMLEQKDKRAMEATRYMQAEIALFHGEAIAFIARYLQKRYGKTYWQAQDEATTVWNILRKNQIRQALAEGRDDAAERLLWECREKFGMPDYLATSRANWPESPCIH